MTPDDYSYYADPEIDEDPYEEILPQDEWGAELVQGMQDLEAQKGRFLTRREAQGLADYLDPDEWPDVEEAYEDYYAGQTRHREPDLGTSAGRTDYMAERLREEAGQD
jgi:hypothetical protein